MGITPEEGYRIDNVLVDGASVGVVPTYTFTNVDQDHTISDTFTSDAVVYKVNNTDTGVGYATIQEAIDAALSGETIVVSSGTYYENIVFNNKNITVRSYAPLNHDMVTITIINGGGSDSVVKFAEGDTSTLQGFTIRNGDAGYGGTIPIMMSSQGTTTTTLSRQRPAAAGPMPVIIVHIISVTPYHLV